MRHWKVSKDGVPGYTTYVYPVRDNITMRDLREAMLELRFMRGDEEVDVSCGDIIVYVRD